MFDLDKKRAECAFGKVIAEKKFKTAVEKMPALVHNNGLIAALAFGLSNDEIKPAAKVVCSWLKQCQILAAPGDEIQQLIGLHHFQLMHATEETFALLSWMKRIVKAKLSETNGETAPTEA